MLLPCKVVKLHYVAGYQINFHVVKSVCLTTECVLCKFVNCFICIGAHVPHNKQTGDTVTSNVVSALVSTKATTPVPSTLRNLTFGDIKAAIVSDITSLIQFDNKFRGDGNSIAPTLVRLAWYSSGIYSKSDQTGGTNGVTKRYQPESE